MAKPVVKEDQLLSDRRVVEEIQRHCWIESEKLGYDIGFDQAKVEWLQKFSKAWLTYHMPDAGEKAAKTTKAAKTAKPTTAKAQKSKAKTTTAKKRRAKSYFK